MNYLLNTAGEWIKSHISALLIAGVLLVVVVYVLFN